MSTGRFVSIYFQAVELYEMHIVARFQKKIIVLKNEGGVVVLLL